MLGTASNRQTLPIQFLLIAAAGRYKGAISVQTPGGISCILYDLKDCERLPDCSVTEPETSNCGLHS